MDAEARLLLASDMTVPSNASVFLKFINKDPWCKTTSTVPGYNDKPCEPIVDYQEQWQQRHPIKGSAILAVDCVEQRHQKIVVLLTSGSSNNSIQ